MPSKLSERDFQYLVEAAKAFERQIEDVTAYPDPNRENILIVIHKDLIKNYELVSWNDDYQKWIEQFKTELLEKDMTSLELE